MEVLLSRGHRIRISEENHPFLLSFGIGSTLYRKSDLCIPRNETVRPRSQFLHSVSVSDLYIPRIGLAINRSQIHECG
jgi:hypothetical protein